MTYKVVYERDRSGWWLARVPQVAGCHTQGRTVDEARRRIREALGLFVDDAATAKLLDAVQMPAPVRKQISKYRMLRKLADSKDVLASRAAVIAVRSLRTGSLKLSTRDAAEVLGISHQRVAQLAARQRQTRR